MAERSFRWLLWTLVLVGTTLDLSSKYLVFRWLHNESRTDEYVIIPGVFKLLVQYTGEQEDRAGLLAPLRTWSSFDRPRVNHGALFGTRLGMNDESAWVANSVFAGVSILAVLAIIYWGSRQTTARDPALCGALGLILAGTLGNLFDRLVFGGVRDFLYFHWFEFPVFNVADSCLVCGAFLLMLQALLAQPAADGQKQLAFDTSRAAPAPPQA